MTIGDWLQEAVAKLTNAGIESARLEATVIAAHALGRTRSEVLAHPEWDLPESVSDFLARRLQGEPIAYITGSREFYGREFAVDPRVLIPRQETEALVERAIAVIPMGAWVWDVGVGSGAIAITLSLERPDLFVIASDSHRSAIDVAIANSRRLGASVSFAHMDGLAAVEDKSIDAIVSNPPYIDPRDTRTEKTVRQFEPASAIFADRGLAFIERLAEESWRVLKPGGVLLFEFGDAQRDDIVRSLSAWRNVEIIKDLSGRDRVAIASKPPI